MVRGALVSLLVLLSACGGGPALTAATRVQAEEACARAEQALEAVAWPAEEELTLPTAAPAIGETRRIHRALIDDLAALPAQGDDRRALDELVASATPLLEALEALERASAAGDDGGFDTALRAVTARGEETARTAERLDVRCYEVNAGAGVPG